MPLVEIPVSLAGDPTTSERQYVQGLLELIDIKYEDSAPAVTVALELCVKDDGTTQTYTEVWRSPSSNTDAYYLPVGETTIPDGTLNGGAAHIPLKSSYGWRLNVIGGASVGVVRAFVGIEQ